MFRRDGTSCLLTGATFNGDGEENGVDPILVHIIPNSVSDKVSANFRYGLLILFLSSA